jgi:5-(carboxyamino)imidazole ribonucleotide synthase
MGGGQLGRMSAMAAAQIGIETHIFTPEENSPASKVAAHTVIASYTDKKALKKFASGVDVITYEFENIPVKTIRFLQNLKPVFPDDNLLEISQHRAREKKFLNDIGIPTARWKTVNNAAQIHSILQEWNASACVLKTARFGYDGKGQVFYRLGDDENEAWAALKTDDVIAEEVVDYQCEISMIIARDKLSQTAVYGPCLNEHINHILYRTTVPAPAPVTPHIAEKAKKMTELLADAVDLVGVMALEMFITADGQILANEIAPRTHNSGHWTIDACACSQFENHVRTVCGLNIGYPARHSDSVMVNLIGKDIDQTRKFMEIKNACIHDYGKPDVREGRKMGHVTILKDRQDPAQDAEEKITRLISAS